jgi:hypothetical protein
MAQTWMFMMMMMMMMILFLTQRMKEDWKYVSGK